MTTAVASAGRSCDGLRRWRAPLEGIVVTNLSEQFADRVFDRLNENQVIRASADGLHSVRNGHPAFEDLEVGEKRTCKMVSVFLDLTDFTARSFWDGAEETADLADGALSGFAYIVTALGGYVLGLRGDGLFAGFGPTADAKVAAAAALAACAASLDAIQSTVNPRLERTGRVPIQARAGIDFGETTFVRTGTNELSEVNAIGFATNFAAKCEKTALSWEVVAGEGLHDLLGPAELFTPHAKSPKPYQRNYKVKNYHFYQCNWRPLVREVDSTINEIAGRSLVGAGF